MIGHLGNFVGLLMALVVLLLRKTWFFSVVLIFTAYIEFINFLGTRQQYIQAMNIEKLLNPSPLPKPIPAIATVQKIQVEDDKQ